MKLKDVYNVSFCKNGILGGLLYVKESELVYCTNKLTVLKKYRRLHMPLDGIHNVTKEPFHTVLVTMENGEKYRFLLFSRKRFLQRIKEKIKINSRN